MINSMGIKGDSDFFHAHASVSSLFALVGVERSLTYETHPTCEQQMSAVAHRAFACGGLASVS